MSELVADMEDWSLQAIVRGSSGDSARINLDIEMNGQDPFFDVSDLSHDHQLFDGEFLAGLPDIFDISKGSSDELEELYKPFYTANHSLPAQAVLEFQEQLHLNDDLAEDKRAKDDQSDQSSGNSFVARVTAGYTPKYKKRKNQHKRVVIQVSEEGLSSDMWAWRKYGQKPIKGSPYPRSYYRCSSSKGCLARKQVEQSCTDPVMFIVIYTEEHSHSHPTRRNSLAGTVRKKFKNTNTTTYNKSTMIVPEKTDQESLSPKTLVSSDQARIISKEENYRAENNEARVLIKGESHSHDDNIMSDDFVFNEDFFSGLEDFDDGFIEELPISYNNFL